MSNRTCSIDGCAKKPQYANGVCAVHYQRFRKYGKYDLPPRVTHCLVKSCGVKLGRGRGRGFCRPHYNRWRKICITTECSIDGCTNVIQARGWCSNHWSKWQRYGDPNHRFGYEVVDGKRVCARCRVDKPVADFGTNLKSYCMRCTADIAIERRRGGLVDLDKLWEYTIARRAQKLSTTAEPFTRVEIFERDNWTCALCGKGIDRSLRHPHPWHGNVDHIMPLSRGGTHTRDNVQATHFRCNLQKGVSIPA